MLPESLVPYFRIKDKELEFEWHGRRSEEVPTLVFLHEGLGSVAMWRDFPEQLATATDCGALVYSRAGYGDSDAAELPRPVKFMHVEALEFLPAVLDAFEIREAIVVGHSDGGSVALIHAGATRDRRLRGLILEAPHVFVEQPGIDSISAIATSYRSGNLRDRLAKYHNRNVDETFWGWNDIWLAREFRSWNIEEYLAGIEVPVLLIQGVNDEYGTLAQVRSIEKGCRTPVRSVLLKHCGHSPHVDQPVRTLAAMTSFIKTL